MTRLLPLALLLVAPPALAQTASGDAVLERTADLLRDDLEHLTWMTATAALLHEADGAFPDGPFALLGSAAATRTGLRALPLSSLTVGRRGGQLRLTYVPLPQDPYVPEDRVVALTVAPDGAGRYVGTYEVRRRADLDAGGAALPYDRAGRYRVRRARGTVTVATDLVRAALADGAFAPDPAAFDPEPVVLRVVPPGESEPVYYQTTAR